jgi:microcystin-dependent protein
MSSPFVAEIRVFPFNFAPKGWAFCDGQLLPLSQNTALFSLLGTTYGGDGKSNFALPDLQGRCMLQQGQGAGLSEYSLGESSGVDAVTLVVAEMPIHNHNLMAVGQLSTTGLPSATSSLARSAGGSAYKAAPFTPTVNMAFDGLPPAGGGQGHNNMMPYLTLNFCIALQGVFPQRP